ncbi:hypothetical protein DITRI_Ditri10aG0038700 [Diplodiscus trichospermus]
MRWVDSWGLKLSAPFNSRSFFMAWQQSLPTGTCNKFWSMIFFTCTWSIWLMRNEIVFNNGILDYAWLIESIKIRLAI